MKGIAILLVIFGHSLQFNVVDFDNNKLFNIIYSFHMPLFFLISGYLHSHSKKTFQENLYSKITVLLVPFVIFETIHYYLYSFDISILDYVLKSEHHYWFLEALFLSYLIVDVVRRISPKINNFQLTIVTILIAFSFGMVHHFSFVYVAKYYMFFAIGYLLKNNFNTVVRFTESKIWYALLLVSMFLLLGAFWTRDLQVVSTVFGYLDNIYLLKILKIIYSVVVALLGSYSVFYLCIHIAKFPISRYFALIGMMSLQLYVLHFYFIDWFCFDLMILQVVVNLIFAFVISFGITFAISRFSILNRIIFGGRSVIV